MTEELPHEALALDEVAHDEVTRDEVTRDLESRDLESRDEVTRDLESHDESTAEHDERVDDEGITASALVLTPQQLEDELQNLRFTRPRVTHAEHGSCIVGVCVCSHGGHAGNPSHNLNQNLNHNPNQRVEDGKAEGSLLGSRSHARWRPLIIQTDPLRAPFGLKQRAGETRGMLELSLDESSSATRAIRAMDAFLASTAGRWFVFRNCGSYLTQLQNQKQGPVRRAEDIARAATYQPIARMNLKTAGTAGVAGTPAHPPLLRVTVPPDLISQAPISRAWVTATIQCVGVWVQDSGDGPARYGCSWKLLNVQKTARPPASSHNPKL